MSTIRQRRPLIGWIRLSRKSQTLGLYLLLPLHIIAFSQQHNVVQSYRSNYTRGRMTVCGCVDGQLASRAQSANPDVSHHAAPTIAVGSR